MLSLTSILFITIYWLTGILVTFLFPQYKANEQKGGALKPKVEISKLN